ncbi:hypothetical protein, partial [Endozoicomonas sp. ONNA2]|uniref:hypothetical protein n=1 Tax=Endozoicomonas sp. ONNA2 TaxID=2828741 RepID=UPI0021477A7F
DKVESKDLASWLYFCNKYFCKEDQRKVLTILTDMMSNPANKQIVMSVLAGIRNHPQEDAKPALELIEQLLRLRGIKQLTFDPDTQKELLNKFVGFLGFKQFKSYHKKSFDSTLSSGNSG